MKIFENKSLLSIFLGVCLQAFILTLGCGGSGGKNGTGGGGEPTGRRLFKPTLTEEELRQRRQDFLTGQMMRNEGHDLGQTRYSLNTHRKTAYAVENIVPSSPILHTYNNPTPVSYFTAKFSDEFRFKLPDSLKNKISSLNINELDLFFTEQRIIKRAEDVSLKAQYWMFPHLPQIDTITGSPSEYNKSVFLGIFESDYAIVYPNADSDRNRVPEYKLKNFKVLLHEGRVSPDTGHINMSVVPANTSFSFYSLAYFEEQHRAAVTLHWMLNDSDNGTLASLLQQGMTFQTLLNALNSSANFRNTPMMARLNALVG